MINLDEVKKIRSCDRHDRGGRVRKEVQYHYFSVFGRRRTDRGRRDQGERSRKVERRALEIPSVCEE